MLSENVWEANSWTNSLSEDDREYMNQVLEKLPEDSRVIIFLHYWMDMEPKEIAEVMGMGLKKIDSIHNSTLQFLSKVFKRKFINKTSQPKEVAA